MFVSAGNEEVDESEIDSDMLLESGISLKRNVDVETRLSEGHQIMSSKHTSITRSQTRPKYNALLHNKVQLYCSLRCNVVAICYNVILNINCYEKQKVM